jgi:hypothetical protein
LVVTMSQISSVPQAAKSVSQALMSNSRHGAKLMPNTDSAST